MKNLTALLGKTCKKYTFFRRNPSISNSKKTIENRQLLSTGKTVYLGKRPDAVRGNNQIVISGDEKYCFYNRTFLEAARLKQDLQNLVLLDRAEGRDAYFFSFAPLLGSCHSPLSRRRRFASQTTGLASE